MVAVRVASAVIVFPARPAAALRRAGRAAANLCSLEEWQADITECIGPAARRGGRSAPNASKAPPPDTPDAGLGGWFASRPAASQPLRARRPGTADYGYAGYSYTTYDIGCAPTFMHPDYKFENTVANGEFMIATAVIGASNARAGAGVGSGRHVGLGRSAGREGDPVDLHAGVHRLRRRHAGHRRASICCGGRARPR